MSIRPTLIVEAIEEDLTCQPGRVGTEEDSWFEVFKGGVLWPTQPRPSPPVLFSTHNKTLDPNSRNPPLSKCPKQHENTQPYFTGPKEATSRKKMGKDQEA